ncbi:unnamed protein product [Clonostachys solani]|uniref:Uncharacterized protein n=1 Tax=Clonostachys solani TaxID=160281 RepID=A0A9N9Z0L0_9HYPO|nr:unnamed protein product [Clonostachys solani]
MAPYPLCAACDAAVSHAVSEREGSGQHMQEVHGSKLQPGCPLCQLKRDCCPGEDKTRLINTKSSFKGIAKVYKDELSAKASRIRSMHKTVKKMVDWANDKTARSNCSFQMPVAWLRPVWLNVQNAG